MLLCAFVGGGRLCASVRVHVRVAVCVSVCLWFYVSVTLCAHPFVCVCVLSGWLCLQTADGLQSCGLACNVYTCLLFFLVLLLHTEC